MGTDIHGIASWGIKTTWGKVESTYKQVREYVGPADGNREFEFDPKTGKSNYVTKTVKPAELEKWDVEDASGRYSRRPTDECVIVLARAETGSHRSGRAPITKVPVLDVAKREEFVRDMAKIDLWSEDNFGLWVYLYISC
jgi:hypothetical protein